MRLSLVLVASLVILLSLSPGSVSGTSGEYVQGELLVRFVPGTPGAAAQAAHQANGASVEQTYSVLNLDLVSVPPGLEQAARAAYQHNPNVLYVELNYIRSIPEPLNHSGGEILPGDFYFGQQWALNNTGQEFYCIPVLGTDWCFYIGTADADIDYPEGLALAPDSSTVTIGVLDTGIDYTHPDLAAKYAGGKDFVNDDDDPMDDHGHGTHVAGTAAALVNNLTGSPGEEEGVAGVAPLANIVSGKICDAAGMCPDDAIIDSLLWVVGCDTNPCGPLRAEVINMSIGAPSPSQAINDAVQVAWNRGAVLVAAAGNDGSTAPNYPAAYPNVLSVGAFDEDGLRAPFSNYGNSVDVSAPGNVIVSTWPMIGCAGAPQVPGDFGCYNFLSGTSMATPHAAGVAAMVLARPDVTTNAQVVDIIQESADPVGVGQVPLGSWTAYGGINLHDALSYAAGPGSNSAPVASDVGVETPVDTAVVWSPDVSDPNAGDALSCTADAVSIQGGTVTVAADCSSGTYTPSVGYEGPDSFEYTVSDGSLGDSATVSVTVQPAPSAGVHVGDLDGGSQKLAKGAWGGIVIVRIDGEAELAASGYTVQGVFSQGSYQTVVSCVTGTAGTCSVTSGPFPSKSGAASFTVTQVDGPLPYSPSANHDGDGDSDGTTIQLSKN